MRPKSVDCLRWMFRAALLTSTRVSMLVRDSPAISFRAVKLWNLPLRSAMEPRSLRLGWSGMVPTELEFLNVEAEEVGDTAVSPVWETWKCFVRFLAWGLTIRDSSNCCDHKILMLHCLNVKPNYCIQKNILPGDYFCCSDCGDRARDKHLENCCSRRSHCFLPALLWSVLARSPGSWGRSDLSKREE